MTRPRIGRWVWNPGHKQDPKTEAYEKKVTGKDDARWEFKLNTPSTWNPKADRPFDGCKNGKILEAKYGCGEWTQQKKLDWYDQASKQKRIADASGAAGLVWFTADPNVPEDVKQWFSNRGIELTYEPSEPPCGE